MQRILAINPGSTSTKITVYEDKNLLLKHDVIHDLKEISKFKSTHEQEEYRTKVIIDFLKENNISLDSIDGFVARGGLMKEIEGGIYRVNEAMMKDLKNAINGDHASNLGALIAHNLSKSVNKEAYITDPVVINELDEIASVTGHKQFVKRPKFHALNQKAIARRYAADKKKKYEDLNLIIAHLGGGISVGIHINGKVVDVNNALDGDGPFSENRSGTLPMGDYAKHIIENKLTVKQALEVLYLNSGIQTYFPKSNLIELEKMYNKGDKDVIKVYDAMVYQVSKSIASLAAYNNGKIDQIILTGGVANSKLFTQEVKNRVSFIAPLTIYPGEDEMLALTEAMLRLLNKEEEEKEY